MTQHIQPSELIIFITHVEADDIYLKIWGQLDKHAATCVERFIHPLVEQFSQGYGCPSKSNRLLPGALCCARFQNDGYYRARILNVNSDGLVVIQFIDYGNVEILPLNEIHLLENIPGSESLRNYPAIAVEFTLVNVLPQNGVWENKIIETIKKILCYNEYTAFAYPMMNNRCLIKLLYNNEDFSELLVKECMALPANVQDMFRPKHILQPQISMYQQNKSNMNNFPTMVQSPNMNRNVPVQIVHKTEPIIHHKHVIPQSPPVQEALVFKSRVLDVDSRYEVLVSFVEDGPQKFSVQVQNTTEILSRLMNDINNHRKKPLQEPPLPGSVCLGRYTQDKVLCRAVVMSVMEHKCKLYYVDFGHTEVLPYTDIFQLPPEFINPKVLSIRFTLSGLKELYITQEMKNYFKELVSRKLLLLHVRPPEGPPLIQYGDLYDNGVNIKDILKKTFPTPATLPMTYSYPQLRRLPKDTQELVHVSFVQSCEKFFVQLDSGIKSLESIMAGLEQFAKTAPAFNITQLKVGLPCAALYDSQWYRAQILSITGDKITVIYVDYGNEEILPATSLCAIHDDLVTKLPAQAIKCTLNGYDVLSLDQEIFNHFEKLTLEKCFHMKVVALQTNGLLVDLFETETMKSVHSLLLNNLSCSMAKNTTTCLQNEDAQYSTNTVNFNGFQRSGIKFQTHLARLKRLNKLKYINIAREDKINKKDNGDSYNRTQNVKSFKENRPNVRKEEWSHAKQYDNKRERIANYSQRDGSQNNKFAKDEASYDRPNRDRFYDKYDKSETDTFNKCKGTFQGERHKSFESDQRYNRNNFSNKAYSDKDSDTSSKGSDKRGFNRDNRGERRNTGMSNRLQTNDTGVNKSRYKEYNNTISISYNKANTCEVMNTNNADKKPQDKAINRFQFLSKNITLGAVKNCRVVHVNNPLDFFVQLKPDYLVLEGMMKNLVGTIQTFDLQCDTCCIIQNRDNQWYRGLIKSVEGNNATVKFVDYGNVESVELSRVRVIEEELLKMPMQAIHCKLLGLTNVENDKTANATFMKKVEGESLEIEFVAEDNGMYEVLLREVIDGGASKTYVNEEFCTDADLMKAKEIAMNRKISNMTIGKIHSPDYVPSNTKWQTILYEPKSKYDVIITWFINPNKFYCQILSEEAAFKTMMNELQRTYIGRKSVTNDLEIGSAVVAIYSEDKALYRAEILSNRKQQSYMVRYIDFGNCATVNQCNIYPVEKKFMQLPKLAVQCSLKDIVPYKDSSWSKINNNALDNCFNAEKYECIFHNCNDNQYTISLIHNGEDVSDTLVRRNLASFVTSTETKIDAISTKEVTNIEAKAFDDVERVDISLLNGQTLKMRVSSVESTTRFHVQLSSALKCENIIAKYMADKNTEVMPRISSREMCLGAGCLISVNGTWRRAVVVNCSRSVGFDIKFIDTGAYDEILGDNNALALPGALAAMQNQSLECSLRNIPTSSDADKELKELIEGKEVLIYVEEVDNSRLIVKLYDLSGKGIMNTEENDEKISPICPMPILSSTHKVSVSCIDHSASIWLQRYSDYEMDNKLLEDLKQYYSNSGQRLKPEMHSLCAAKSVDGLWYRGEIIEYTDTTAYINYIDYGNIEEVPLESIMVLEPRFYEPYRLAINVSLSVTLTGTDAEKVNMLQARLLDKELTAIFYNVRKKWIVDLMENGEKLGNKFFSLNPKKEEEVIPKSSSQAPTTCKFDVCVSHVDSPSQFWLQRIDEISTLTEKQEKLQLEVSDSPEIDDIPEEGYLCVAVYSIDNLWYCAEVLDADEDITTVRFIDYGNTDVIDNKANRIRQMPDTWKNVERCAFKCRLDVIPVDTEDWSESTCERFESLVTSVESLQAAIVTDTTPKRVELFINDKSVSEILVEEKHAIKINPEQAEPVDEIVDLELDPHSAFVCHINSPNEFWVQEEKSVADLEVMTDRFMVADLFPKIEEVKEDLLCVAKYPEDEQWYRARVLSYDDNGVRVIYIDYGNSSTSTEIRTLPEDLAAISPLSRKCCLELPSQVKEWSEQACEEFVKLAADGATIFLLDVLKERDTSIVKLTLNNQNVADVLANLCEQHLSVIEERLPPLGEENSPNVVVSHINNPSEFWIQEESSISELEVMSDRLRDAESFLILNTTAPGTICAALYPEDGFWYRARIIARRELGAEVLYIDYGNSAVTEELRMLPEDIVNIPVLSKRCALEKATWSEEACEKFKELAAEGATMFQFESLDENDPTRVRLSLNGTNVVELLSTECENVSKIQAEDTVTDVDMSEKIVTSETISYDEKTSSFISIIEEPIVDDRTDSSDNLNCINETEKSENATDDKVIDKSSDISDINEHTEKQDRAESSGDIEENVTFDKESEIVISEDIAETSGTPKDIPEEKAVSTRPVEIDDECLNHVTTVCPEESSSVLTELSVDEIVENMARDINGDLESREIEDANSLDTNKIESESVSQSDAKEQQELLSQVESEEIRNIPPDMQIVSNSIEISSNAVDIAMGPVSKEISSVAEASSQNIAQLNTSEIEEQTTISDDATCLPCDQTALESMDTRDNSEDTNILESMDKRDNSEDTSENKNILESTDEKDNSEVTSENITNTADSVPSATSEFTGSECGDAAIPTSSSFGIEIDPVEKSSPSSESRSDDNIVSECVFKSDSCPLTPKTSNSEKLTVDVVNFQKKEAEEDCAKEETITVSSDDNIPKHMV